MLTTVLKTSTLVNHNGMKFFWKVFCTVNTTKYLLNFFAIVHFQMYQQIVESQIAYRKVRVLMSVYNRKTIFFPKGHSK